MYRGTYPAVQEVSFTIPAGTDAAIIDPNGAGKSTLIQAVLGVLPRQAGQVSVLGHALSAKGYLPSTVQQQLATRSSGTERSKPGAAILNSQSLEGILREADQ